MATGVTNNKADRVLSCQLRLSNGQRMRLGFWWIFWLVLMVSGLALSQWQWQRADEKKQLQLQQNQQQTLYNPQTEPVAFSLITLTGYFHDQQSLWLDNRIYQGKVGVALLTPFIDINGRWWLVDRGFIYTAGKRGSLQHLLPEPDSSLKVISGVWQLLNKKQLVLADNREGDRLQSVELDAWPDVNRRYHGVLHLDTANPAQRSGNGELLIPWWQASQISPERHIGYSLQWFLLALLALVFAVIGRRNFLTN